MTKKEFQLILTTAFTLIYCLFWVSLEYSIDKQIQDKFVDNIILTSFVPMIWLAMGAVFDNLKKLEDKRAQKRKELREKKGQQPL